MLYLKQKKTYKLFKKKEKKVEPTVNYFLKKLKNLKLIYFLICTRSRGFSI